MEKIFDPKVVEDFVQDVMTIPGADLILKKGTIAVLPIGEYQKYQANYHDSSSFTLETFEDRGYGLVVGSGVPGINVGDRLHYLNMRGAKIHLNPVMDVHIKVLNDEDWLFQELRLRK